MKRVGQARFCGWPGKVVVVAVAYVGPEINFFPLRPPNRFWPETCQVDGKVCVDGKFSKKQECGSVWFDFLHENLCRN